MMPESRTQVVPGHLAVAVQGEPGRVDRVGHLPAARPYGGDSGAHRALADHNLTGAADDRGVTDLDAGDIGDCIESAGGALEGDAEVSGAWFLGGGGERRCRSGAGGRISSGWGTTVGARACDVTLSISLHPPLAGLGTCQRPNIRPPVGPVVPLSDSDQRKPRDPIRSSLTRLKLERKGPSPCNPDVTAGSRRVGITARNRPS